MIQTSGKRQKYIRIRLTEEEYSELYDRCVLSGRTASALIRESIKHTKTWTAVDQTEYRARTMALVRISDALETLAKRSRLIPKDSDTQRLTMTLEKVSIVVEKLWKERTLC